MLLSFLSHVSPCFRENQISNPHRLFPKEFPLDSYFHSLRVIVTENVLVVKRGRDWKEGMNITSYL